MKKKRHMSKWIIPFVIISIFSFTIAAMYVQIVSGVELSATLIGCFFGFCTGELWLLASIKKAKIAHPEFVDDPNTPQDESQIYSEIYQQGYEDAMAQLREKFFNEGGKGNG
jgi:L-lactate permease